MRPTEVSAASRIGSRVRGLMAEKRVTQEQVGASLGLSQVAISRRLSGRVPFDVNELKAVSVLLGEPMSALTEAA